MRSEAPGPDNLKYLECRDGKNTIKKGHEYYYQMQTQMGVCDCDYCDIFVYSSHGFHLERISFDSDFWKSVLLSITNFWKLYIAPELITQNVWKQRVSTTSQTEPESQSEQHNDHNYNAVIFPPRTVKSSYKPQPTDVLPLPMYVCGECSKDAITAVVQCDICKL